MKLQGRWITAETGADIVPVFRRVFSTNGAVKTAVLRITALGVYEAELNGKRVGNFVLAPGWTVYRDRLQVQTYDVKDLLQAENRLDVLVGRGWFSSPLGYERHLDTARKGLPKALLAELSIEYEDGRREVLGTGEDWTAAKSGILKSEIYDGEHADGRIVPEDFREVQILPFGQENLIPQEGEEIREVERIPASRIFTAPNGETIVDFGQEVTGYVEITVDSEAGSPVLFDHGEVLDKDGNFYNENYRTAKAEASYILRQGRQTWHPRLTFYGFRLIRLKAWPGGPENAKASDFTAVVLSSDLRRTGRIETSSGMLDRLVSNVFWSQRGNFLDVPTDCPQRDERLGWTGDAEVFCRTACYNYDTERFFRKWLKDMACDQRPNGSVPHVIPDVLSAKSIVPWAEELRAAAEAAADDPQENGCSAAWGDASVIVPWTVYEMYGDPEVLREAFPMMKAYVDYIGSATTTPDLWTGGWHFGDWLGLDAPSGSYKGSSREDLIASAFYAYSCGLLVKAGKVLGTDVRAYEELHGRIVRAFCTAFPDLRTQTEHVLALFFGLSEDPEKTAADLASMIRRDGQMMTGFVGTPYLLHVLSDNGYKDLAYDLLLREDYPSWLYSVRRGATTTWEHWDGIQEDGSFWSADMNSFNHYSYGAVLDWVYQKAAGIRPLSPGFSEVLIAPEPAPEEKLKRLSVIFDSPKGRIASAWSYEGGRVRYEVETPVKTIFRADSEERILPPGRFVFYGPEAR